MNVYCHEFELKLHQGDVLHSLYIASAMCSPRSRPAVHSSSSAPVCSNPSAAARSVRRQPRPTSAGRFCPAVENSVSSVKQDTSTFCYKIKSAPRHAHSYRRSPCSQPMSCLLCRARRQLRIHALPVSVSVEFLAVRASLFLPPGCPFQLALDAYILSIDPSPIC
jgi:hypothetical protein